MLEVNLIQLHQNVKQLGMNLGINMHEYNDQNHKHSVKEIKKKFVI